MRTFALLALLPALALGGIALKTTPRYEFTNCAAAGSVAQTVTGGEYLLRVTDADSRVCITETANPDAGTSCGFYDGGTPGEMFPSGTVMKLQVPGASKSVSCSSSAATGDVYLTGAQ